MVDMKLSFWSKKLIKNFEYTRTYESAYYRKRNQNANLAFINMKPFTGSNKWSNNPWPSHFEKILQIWPKFFPNQLHLPNNKKSS